jgi:hypothetical protein
MGAVDVWEVESCTEFEAARGRSPQTQIIARHREISAGAGVLPAEGLQRLCGPDRFPRFLYGGEDRRQFTLYRVEGLQGLEDGFYGTAPGPDVKVIYNRWFRA